MLLEAENQGGGLTSHGGIDFTTSLLKLLVLLQLAVFTGFASFYSNGKFCCFFSGSLVSHVLDVLDVLLKADTESGV